MRILALDIGERRIGVAVSDELGLAAHAVETITRSSLSKDFSRLKHLVNEYGATRLVVGLPLNMNGTQGPQGDAVMQFVEAVKKRFSSLPVVTWDERLTSLAAEHVLIEADMSRAKRKKKIDQVAAVLILQGYLDSLPQGTAAYPP